MRDKMTKSNYQNRCNHPHRRRSSLARFLGKLQCAKHWPQIKVAASLTRNKVQLGRNVQKVNLYTRFSSRTSNLINFQLQNWVCGIKASFEVKRRWKFIHSSVEFKSETMDFQRVAWGGGGGGGGQGDSDLKHIRFFGYLEVDFRKIMISKIEFNKGRKPNNFSVLPPSPPPQSHSSLPRKVFELVAKFQV